MKRSYLKNAALLSFGSLAAKGIGALYRVLLLSAVGSYGMGLYHMAYPLFCLLLTFSSAGIPTALARIVARENAAGGESGTLKAALKLFSLLGLAGTGLLLFLAPAAAKLQGEPSLSACYTALAPSVFFIALIAVLRGYFQGKHDMLPTALSEIFEQLIKVAFGLFFAYRYTFSPQKAVTGALFAVTLSELFALLFLAIPLKKERRPLYARQTGAGEIARASLPVMAATSILPLSGTLDSVFIVRLLSKSAENAVSLYGLYAGGALALVGLPASVIYGLAAASVPAVAALFGAGREEEGMRRVHVALLITLSLSLAAAAGLFFLAPIAAKLLFPTLSEGDSAVLIRLIRTMSLSAVPLAGVDTLAACLAGMGRAKYAAGAMGVAVLVKHALQLLLIPRLGIMGAAIAANTCYLIAFFLDLVYTEKKETRKAYDYCRGTRRRGGRARRCGETSYRTGG